MANCGICLDGYDDPRVLPCGHSFCKPCIQKLVQQSLVKCPHCQQQFATPNSDTNFPRNYMLASLLRCDLAKLTCTQHSKKVKFYCADCDLAACAECLLAQHNGHKFERFADADCKWRQQCDAVRKQVDCLVSEIAATAPDSQRFQQFNSCLQDAVGQYDSLIEQLRAARQNLLDYGNKLVENLLQEAQTKRTELLERANALAESIAAQNAAACASMVPFGKSLADMQRQLELLRHEMRWSPSQAVFCAEATIVPDLSGLCVNIDRWLDTLNVHYCDKLPHNTTSSACHEQANGKLPSTSVSLLRISLLTKKLKEPSVSF